MSDDLGTSANPFEKQPAEKYDIAVDFRGQLPPSRKISSCTVSAYKTNNTPGDSTGTVLTGTTATVDGTKCSIGVLAGTATDIHRITFVATLNAGQPDILEEDVFMEIVAVLS